MMRDLAGLPERLDDLIVENKRTRAGTFARDGKGLTEVANRSVEVEHALAEVKRQNPCCGQA